MNRFDKELLVTAYKNYLQTSSRYGSFRMYNRDAFLRYKTAAMYLVDNNLIIPLSKNISSNTVNFTSNLLEFELTDEGIWYCQDNLKL